MVKSLSSSITEYLGKNNSSLTKTDLLKINYALQVVLGDSTKLIILLLIFLYLKQLPVFFLSFAILTSTRPFGGGLHCKTFLSCLVVSIIYFISVMLFSTFFVKLSIYFYIVFFTISFIILIKYAPCPNEKRPIQNKERLKVLSLISLTFWMIVFFIFFVKFANIQICNCILACLFIQVFQLIIYNIKGVIFNAKIYKFFFSNIT